MRVIVARQAVEIGAEMTGERLQPIEAARPIRTLRRTARCAACAVNMPAQPQAFSLVARSCGALSVPRKKRGLPLVAAAEQRLPIALALQYRQAIVMRPDAARKNRIAIVQQMLRRDGRGDAGAARRRRIRPRVRS